MASTKNYDVILFDLDGTLTDPELGITTCVQYALKQFGIEVEDRSSLRSFIGPPLMDSFMKQYGFDQEQAEEAVAKYRERFSTVGLFENKVYPGIDLLLDKLKQQGKLLATASSKPEKFVVQILEHFGLDGYFDEIAGAELSVSGRNSKEDVLRYVLDRLGVEDKSSTVLIGDTKFDIQGAKAVGIDCIGVTYGFGEAADFRGAVAVANSPAELEKILR